MKRWIWFRNLRLEDFLGPVPERDVRSDSDDRSPDRRAAQAEMLALRRLGRTPA